MLDESGLEQGFYQAVDRSTDDAAVVGRLCAFDLSGSDFLLSDGSAAAREAGMTRSLFIERILLAAINQRLWQRGERMLDGIGKYMSDDEMQRVHAASDAAGAAQYAQRTVDYGAPPVLRPGPAPGGLPRWTPPPASGARKK